LRRRKGWVRALKWSPAIRCSCALRRPVNAHPRVAGWLPDADGGSSPKRTPRALARVRPSLVRARISSRSNSAKPPSTVNISRPCGVVVSAHLSVSDLKPAPALAIMSRILSRSRVDPPLPTFTEVINPARVVSFCHEESALVPSQKGLMGSKAAFGSGRNTIPLHTLTADITWKRVPTPLTWNAACNAIRDHHT
jgi:hypothetical protein